MIQSEWFCLVGATLLHVVGVPVAYAIAPERTATTARQRVSLSEIDVDVDDAFKVKPPPPQFRMDQQHGVPLGMRNSRLPHNPHYDPSRAPTPGRRRIDPNARNPGEPVLTAPDGAETNNDTFNPDGSWNNAPGPGEAWGIPGVDPDLPYWALPGAPGIFTDGGDGPGAPTKTKKRKYDPDAPSKIVAEGVRKKDRKLGLDFPGRGPIRSAFVGATYSSDAPYECRAAFGLSVNGAGKVTAVKYVSHTGGSTGTWKSVASSVLGQLKGVKLIMRSSFKKGANVTVIVVSRKKTPGGGTSRDGATINFDVTDIGAKPTRLVSASVSPSPVK